MLTPVHYTGARCFVVPCLQRDGTAWFTTNEQAMKTKATASKATRPTASAADAIKTQEMAITFGTSVLTQARVDKIQSAFASAKGRLRAVEPNAIKAGIIRAGTDWLGESVVRTDSSQAVRVAGRLERAGLISSGDAKALREYMALRNAMSALGL